MHVIQVVPSVAERTGGTAIVVPAQARALSQRGVRTTLLSTDAAGPADWRVEGSSDSFGGIPHARTPLRRPQRWLYSPQMRDLLRQTVASSDLVHSHGLYLYPHYATWRVCRDAGIPYVVSPHGTVDPFMRQHHRLRKSLSDRIWGSRYLADAAAIIVTSRREERFTQALAPSVPCFVVPNGVAELPSPPAAERDSVLELLRGAQDGPLIVNVGRLSFKKRLNLIVEALPALAKEFPGVHAAFVGPDDENIGARLHSLARQLRVEDRLQLVGMVPRDELRPYFEAADVWVLPSASENFGVAIVEALHVGTPVVISTDLDLAAELSDAGAAVACDVGRPGALATSIRDLLSNPQLQAQLAARGRRFSRRYDWDVVATRMEEVYAAAIKNG